MSNFKCKIVVSFVFSFSFFALPLSVVNAITMSNDTYILQGDLNAGSGNSSSSKYEVGTTIGQTAPGLYSGKNYTVRAGFEYLRTNTTFSFRLSSQAIDFGALTATNPVSRKHNLTVITGGTNGYSVLASEDHELLVPASGATIPDTSCDSGTCTETKAGTWTSTLTYGFGFRCENVSGSDCSSDFATANTYKQFANRAKRETPQAVMQSSNSSGVKKADVTYKVNISGTQPAGMYTNTITLVAVPGY